MSEDNKDNDSFPLKDHFDSFEIVTKGNEVVVTLTSTESERAIIISRGEEVLIDRESFEILVNYLKTVVPPLCILTINFVYNDGNNNKNNNQCNTNYNSELNTIPLETYKKIIEENVALKTATKELQKSWKRKRDALCDILKDDSSSSRNVRRKIMNVIATDPIK